MLQNTDNCRLVFSQPISSKATLFLEGNTQHQIECTDFRELEILKFDRKEQSEYITYELFGSDNGFCEWKVEAKRFDLYWNDFVADAWFVHWKG